MAPAPPTAPPPPPSSGRRWPIVVGDRRRRGLRDPAARDGHPAAVRHLLAGRRDPGRGHRADLRARGPTAAGARCCSSPSRCRATGRTSGAGSQAKLDDDSEIVGEDDFLRGAVARPGQPGERRRDGRLAARGEEGRARAARLLGHRDRRRVRSSPRWCRTRPAAGHLDGRRRHHRDRRRADPARGAGRDDRPVEAGRHRRSCSP